MDEKEAEARPVMGTIFLVIMYLLYIVYLKMGLVIKKVYIFFLCLCWVPNVVAGWLKVIENNCCRL